MFPVRCVPALVTISVVIGTFIGLPATVSSQVESLRGFTDDRVAPQRSREATFQAVPQPENLRKYMRTISAEPHHAGAPGSKKVADFILSKFEEWGLNAWIEEQEALMPFPVERRLELLGAEPYRASLREPTIPEDADSGDEGGLPPYNAYSADGDVTANLVFVNYGIPEDYDTLEELGIDVAGKIVLAKYGRSWRGIKPKVAAEHGAVGCIIYSDPKDDGYFQGDVYPEGSWRPWEGAQRGSVMDMPTHPGDPLTPGWGAEAGGKRLDRADAKTLMSIPVLPISYQDAQPFLRSLRGPVAPEEWRGALPLTYHVGPSEATVRLTLSFDWQVRPLYNVLARIDGATFPDEWIVHGNHHDAWVNGAEDPTSGNVALMETARGFSELVAQGWQPDRTIILASWDGEEWGLLGSTEWAERHADELRDKAVVYINTDTTGKGWLTVAGSHSLQALVTEVAGDLDGPRGDGTVLDEARAHLIDEAETDEDKERLTTRSDLPIAPLGSGSDYTTFLDHLTIAALDLRFGGESDGGIYHSVYDSFEWYTRFGDPDFTFGRTLSRVVGTIILRLADASVLPFQFGDYAETIGTYVDEIEEEATEADGAPPLDLGPVRAALARLDAAAAAHESALEALPGADASVLATRADALGDINRLLYRSERALGHAPGLPKREWFRHLVYAPGFYTGYGVKTLPGIREGLEQEAWDEAAAFVPIVAAALEELAGQVDAAATALSSLLQ